MRSAGGDVRDHIVYTKTTTDLRIGFLVSIAAVETSKHRLSRDSPGRSIFDFCNSICHYRKSPLIAVE